MVWIYNSPLSEKERKAYDVLKERFGNSELAKDTVKIISLYSIVKHKKFESPKELQTYFYYDTDQKVPIFTKTLSEKLFKQSGGAASNYPFLDYSAGVGLEKASTILPGFIVYPIENTYKLLTTPLLTLKERVPVADLIISAANGAAETGITAIGDIAKTLGGPMGTAISIPIVAFASAVATMSSMAQRDLGQSVVYMVTAVPVVGSIMVKMLDKVEKQVAKFKKYPEIAYYVPYISDYINAERAKQGLPPLEPFDPEKALQAKLQANPYTQRAMTVANKLKGGNRFSTRKHSIHKKWQRTRRNKSAKI